MARVSAEAKAKNAANQAARYSNPDHRAKKLANMNRTHHERLYGISRTRYESMCAARNNLCDVCDGPPVGGRGAVSRLVVDHDHATGAIRGLLCNNCNTAIGLLRDDPSTIARVVCY